MRIRTLLAVAAVGVTLAGTATPALAAGNEQSGATVGDCISDGFYGNEPNVVDGHKVPSQSPGPKKTLPDGSVVQGASVGDYHQQYGGGVVPAFCRTLTQ